jgi:hypothetical protein
VKRIVLAGVAAVGFVLADADAARAQFWVGPGCRPGFGWGGGFAFGGGFGFRGGFIGGFSSGFVVRSWGFGPAWCGPRFAPVVPLAPVFPPVAPLTPWGWGPGFLQPGWGVGPGWGWNPLWAGIPRFWGAPGWGPWGWNVWNPWGVGVIAPPFFPPPIILAGGAGNGDPNGNAVAAVGVAPRRPPDPGPRGDFIVITPDGVFPPRGQVAPAVDRVAAPPVPPPRPAFAFDPFAAGAPKIDTPDPDAEKELGRLLRLGREAFAAGDYVRAGDLFDRATAAGPRAAAPHFLKAQAMFASGAYADAVAALRSGLALDPEWPAGTFDPKEPYGANAAAFAAHLAELRKVVAANPGQPALEFLLGYQLWFIGEKVEAKKWFDAAAKRLADPGPVALFK